MEIVVRGRSVNVTERVQEYVEKKVGKLERYLPIIDEARMELSQEETRSAQHRMIAQLTVRSRAKCCGRKSASRICLRPSIWLPRRCSARSRVSRIACTVGGRCAAQKRCACPKRPNWLWRSRWCRSRAGWLDRAHQDLPVTP